MNDLIVVAALSGAGVCLGVYLWLMVKLTPVTKKADNALQQMSASGEHLRATSPEVTAVITALSAFAEALAKAGPGLWALMGSLLFLLIASLAAGVFTSVS